MNTIITSKFQEIDIPHFKAQFQYGKNVFGYVENLINPRAITYVFPSICFKLAGPYLSTVINIHCLFLDDFIAEIRPYSQSKKVYFFPIGFSKVI